MRTCSTALAKHMFPVLTRPRGRIFIKGWLDGPEVKRDSNSGFLGGRTGGTVKVGDAAGMENPTTEDFGRAFGFDEAGSA